MNTDIEHLQTRLDKTKEQLKSVGEYAALSGLGMLPRNWIVEPYVYSTQTGIHEQVNDENNVVGFNFEFKVKTKKHYIDEKPCDSETNSTLVVGCSVASGDWKPVGDYSQEEKTALADQSKIDSQVYEFAIKQTEVDCFQGILDFILKED